MKLCPICKGEMVSYPSSNDTMYRCSNNHCKLSNVAFTKKLLDNPIFELDFRLNHLLDFIKLGLGTGGIKNHIISVLEILINRGNK